MFVALTAEGQAAPVPPWQPETELDRALETYAMRLGELRNQMDVEMERALAASR